MRSCLAAIPAEQRDRRCRRRESKRLSIAETRAFAKVRAGTGNCRRPNAENMTSGNGTNGAGRCCPSSSTPALAAAIPFERGALSQVGPKGVTTLRMNSNQALDRAEALFKKKEERVREGRDAVAQYVADRHAAREKTARLRSLRLARDAADNRMPVLPANKRPASGE